MSSCSREEKSLPLRVLGSDKARIAPVSNMITRTVFHQCHQFCRSKTRKLRRISSGLSLVAAFEGCDVIRFTGDPTVQHIYLSPLVYQFNQIGRSRLEDF